MLHRIVNRVFVTAGLLSSVAAGCASSQSQLASTEAVEGPQPIQIIYRTDSGRLAEASGDPDAQPLPPGAVNTLKVITPHPSGDEEMAQVVLSIAQEARSGPGGIQTVSAVNGQSASGSFEVWTLDVPREDAARVMKELREKEFLSTEEIVYAESFVGVSVDGETFATNYRDVQALDQLIVRTRREGQKVYAGGTALAHAERSRSFEIVEAWADPEAAPPPPPESKVRLVEHHENRPLPFPSDRVRTADSAEPFLEDAAAPEEFSW